MARKRNSRPLEGMGRFVAVPMRVIDSDAYKRLSHPAARLLWDIATQCHGDDNGRLLTSIKYMAARGWKSCDTLHRAVGELERAGFIFKTVQGHRPNKASWWAVTFRPLNRLDGFDAGAEAGFSMWQFEKQPPKNESINPSGGVESAPIVPSGGVEGFSIVPSGGAIEAIFDPLPIPSRGNPLEMPSLRN